MRKVFVYYKDNTYNIIDKETNTLFYKINDVILINATRTRCKGIKGWEGFLSEEINQTIISLLNNKFYELVYKGKETYPRMINFDGEVIKKVGCLRLKYGVESVRSSEYHYPDPARFLNKWSEFYPEIDGGNNETISPNQFWLRTGV